MNNILILLASLLMATAGHAQQKLLPTQSEITFTIKQMGVPVDGKFTKFEAQLTFDAKKPDVGHAAFSIDLGSAVIGDAETSKELKKPQWFDHAKFPSATFISSAIKSTGPGKLEIAGMLSIKGNAKPVTVPVTLTSGPAGITTAQGSFNIKRIDFKIGEGDWADVSVVANDVLVKFKLVLSGV